MWNLLIAVLLPLLAVPLYLRVFKKNRLWGHFLLVGLTIAIFSLALGLIPAVRENLDVSLHVISMLEVWEIVLQVDAFGLLFALLTSGLWIFTVLYSIGYMEGEWREARFFAFLAICLGVTMGIAFSGNLFTLYLFYEILTFVSYPLVVHYQTKEAMQAGRRYLTYSLSGAAAILLGLIVTYTITGSLEFAAGGLLRGTPYLQENKWVLEVMLALFVLGFGVKAAIMPLHNWLPAAMVAPTPVSALFHAVAVVNSGLFGIIRVLYGVFGLEVLRELMMAKVFLGLVMVTVLAGSVIAFLQDNLKKRLAYSTISQLGYISLGVLLLSPAGWRGGVLHIVNHGLLKIVLFFCAGIIYKVTHKKKISEIYGIGRKMPLTMGIFALASLGMVGIPPTNGLVSKWFLLEGGFSAGSLLAVGVLLFSSLLNAGYFLPIVINAFFKAEREELHGYQGRFEAPVVMLFPILAIIGLALFFGVMPQIPLALVEKSLEMMGIVE